MTLYSDACKRRHYSQLWLLSHIYGLLSNLPFFRPFHFCNLTIMNGIGTSVTLRHPYLMPNLTILEIIFFFPFDKMEQMFWVCWIIMHVWATFGCNPLWNLWPEFLFGLLWENYMHCIITTCMPHNVYLDKDFILPCADISFGLGAPLYQILFKALTLL